LRWGEDVARIRKLQAIKKQINMRKEIKHFKELKPIIQKQIETFLKDSMDFKMQSRKHKIYQRGKVELIYKGKSLFETEFNRGVTPFVHSHCLEQLKKSKDKIKSSFEINHLDECFASLEKTINCLDQLKEIETPKIKQIEVDKEKWITLLSNFPENPGPILDFYEINQEVDRQNDEFGLLGCYNRSTHVVKLFLDAILDWAILIDIDPTIAFKLTFRHEMAHKFHHIGIDEEGRNWDSDYGVAHINIKEGLTQWYSLKFAEELDNNGYSGYTNKAGKLLKAEEQFEIEASKLPNPYKYYRHWKKYRFETVRISMIHARQNKTLVDKDFDILLKDYDSKSI